MAMLRCSECGRRTSDAGGVCENCGREIDDTFEWIAGRRSAERPRPSSDEAVADAGASGAASSETPGDLVHPRSDAGNGGRTSRRRPVLGGVLLACALVLGLGAWSTYRSPFISFGAERLALSDAAMRDLEELSRQMGQTGAGGALNQLSGGIVERIRNRRRAVKLAFSGCVACALLGLIAFGGAPFGRPPRSR